ncbi:MAG: hypothetical protein NVS1B12_00310 [Acidimicrobiales bacterium]
MRARARVRQGCFAAATAVVAWSLLVPGSGAETATAPRAGSVFAAVASASGVLQHTDARMGLSATSEPVYGSVPDVSATFASGAGHARASTYYPGATVLGLGGLIGTAGGPGGLPGYPFTAIADDQHPDSSIPAPAPLGGAGQPASAESGTAVAHVDAAGTTADAVVSAFNAPGTTATGGHATPDSVVHVGSVQAHSRQRFDAAGKLVSHADALVSDITIAGGVHIGSVATTSTTTVGAGGTPAPSDMVTVTGATFMGNPVSIGADGVSVIGPGQGKAALDLANATLQQALSAAGVRIHVVGVSHPPAALNPRGCSKGEADGLEISAQVDASGVPAAGNVYYTDILLGAACTTAAYMSPAEEASPPPVATGDGGSSSPGAVPPVAPVAAPDAPIAAVPQSAPVPAAGAGTPARITPPKSHRAAGRAVPVDLTSATVARRLRALYLAIGLIALGLVLGAKSLVPSRLPGVR